MVPRTWVRELGDYTAYMMIRPVIFAVKNLFSWIESWRTLTCCLWWVEATDAQAWTLRSLSVPCCYFVQSPSPVRLFVTLWTAAHQASLSFGISWSLLKLMSTESVLSSNHPILCHPLLLLLSIFPSIRLFSNESALRIRWPQYWSFSFIISPSNEYSVLTSFRIDWFDPCSPRTLKSLLSTTVPKHQFFSAQPSLWPNPHIRNDCWKTTALTIWTFVGKMMSLLFKMLFRFDIAFLPSSVF